MTAVPIPPPMHRLARPSLLPAFIISCSSVTIILFPLAPTGCPSAMAPPLGLQRASISFFLVALLRQLVYDAQGLRGKRFVKLQDLHLAEFESAVFKRLQNRRHGTESHELRVYAALTYRDNFPP